MGRNESSVYLVGLWCAIRTPHEPHRVSRGTRPTDDIFCSGVAARPGAAAVPTGADPVNHPAHYTAHPSGIECIEITEHMGFNLGNAVKYIWRADLKNDALEDLRKAAWYLQREIDKRLAAAGRIGESQ